jgi:hypothetical protein
MALLLLIFSLSGGFSKPRKFQRSCAQNPAGGGRWFHGGSSSLPDFGDRNPHPPGQIQNLKVDAEAVDGTPAEKLPGRFPQSL